MKITMRTLSAGPQGNMEPGKTYEIEDKFARDLISGGFAIAVKEPAAIAAPVEETVVETAVAALAPEKAVSRRGKATTGRSKKG